MADVCFYFQVHQPFRLKRYSIFDIGTHKHYFDEHKNREVMEKVAKKCYLPTNHMLLELIKRYPGKFKVAFSITGTALEQFSLYVPDVLDSFKALAKTGQVEFLAETYYHSLSFLYNKQEFKEQVEMHIQKMQELFHHTPVVFRNTELIYSNDLAYHAEQLGFTAVLAEGHDHILGWKSPNFVYTPYKGSIKLLLKNYKLSDDVAFRFSDKSWVEHPLSADRYATWVHASQGDSVNLFMDYETFGEHQWDDTGIFAFLEHLPDELFKRGLSFRLPRELAQLPAKDALDIHNFISWADNERDLSAWKGNRMQDHALEELYKLEEAVKKTRDSSILEDWRKLQTSDHFYYMCTKYFNDGDVHKYFNPYESPYEGFVAFMNVLNDLVIRINTKLKIQLARPKPQTELQQPIVLDRPSQHLAYQY
ncbi:MAG: glycoside hydrolase family 57 protein [archaeon]